MDKNIVIQCRCVKNNKQCKNTTKNKSGYCYLHNKDPNMFLQKKPEKCPICFNSLFQVKIPLECGHWVHKSCILKGNKLECPLCKKFLSELDSFQEPKINDIYVVFSVMLYKLYNTIFRPIYGQIFGLSHFTSAVLNEIIRSEHPKYNIALTFFYARVLTFL